MIHTAAEVTAPDQPSQWLLRPAPVAKIWGASLPWHMAAYALLLIGVTVSIPLGSSASSDEGAYAVQVQAVQQGGWSFEHPYPAIDPDGVAYPFVNSRITDEGYFPLATSPVYIRLLQGSVGIFGRDLGLHVPSLVGALIAATAAWHLGSLIRASLARAAFWLVATGPVLVNAPMLWAHSLAAGLTGVALIGAVRIVRNDARPAAWALFAGGLLGAVAVRSDAVAMAAAVCLVVGVFALYAKHYRAAIGSAVVAGMTAAFVLGQRRWTAAVTGADSAQFDRRSRGADPLERVNGVYSGLARGGWSNERGIVIGLLLAVVVALVARAVWNRLPTMSNAIIGGAVAVVALLTIRHALAPEDPITGLLVAWPILALGLVARRWSELDDSERLLLVVVGVAAAGVIALQHASGAGLEWGGRYYSTLLVPLAVLVAGGLQVLIQRAGETATGRTVVNVPVALVTIAVVPTVFGMWITDNMRDRHERIITQIEELDVSVAISAEPALPRVAWRSADSTAWLRADQLDPQLLVEHVATSSAPARMALIGVDQADPVAGYQVTEPAAYIWVYERIS